MIENEMQEKDMFAQSFRIGRLYKWAGPGSLGPPTTPCRLDACVYFLCVIQWCPNLNTSFITESVWNHDPNSPTFYHCVIYGRNSENKWFLPLGTIWGSLDPTLKPTGAGYSNLCEWCVHEATSPNHQAICWSRRYFSWWDH